MPKILFLSGYNFDRVDSGATVRALNVYRLLSRVGSVRVVLASPWEQELRDAESLRSSVDLAGIVRFRFTGGVPLRDRLRHEFDGRFLNTAGYQALAKDVRRLQALMADHDLVWVYGLTIPNAFGLWRWPHTVLDFDDIPSCVHRTAMIQASGFLKKLSEYRQMLLWRRREKFLLERFDAICSASEADRDTLRRSLGRSERLHVVPNGFAAPEQEPKREPAAPPRIGFVGNPGFGPNGEGIRWFIEHAWPIILERLPLARLRLVGAGTEKRSRDACKNIDGLGWVADIESEMATWSLTVVPIFYGGGTRIKTAEAFSRKCPVVSTTLGVYGYEVVDGREVLLADSAEEFASKCLRILTDPSAGVAMAEVAWQRFLKHWTWDSYADRVADVVNTVLQTKTFPCIQGALAAHGTSQS